jgi:hypothetical protein
LLQLPLSKLIGGKTFAFLFLPIFTCLFHHRHQNLMRILLLIALFPCAAFAQTNFLGASGQTIDLTSEIFNGKEHPGYMAGITGTAYYVDKDWQPGSIVYRDIYYPSMYVKYDLVQKELIVRHPSSMMAITLFTPRISSFSISGRNFIRISENDTSCLAPGIYEEIQKGRMNFYILRSKYLLETPKDHGMEREFLTNDSYYVVIDSRCYSLKKKKNIWNLVKGKKPAIKADLRKKELNYRRNREATLTEIITYYNDAAN